MKCVYYAVKLFVLRGGYLWMRKSKYSKYLPHFGWSKSVSNSESWQPDDVHLLIGWKMILFKFFEKGKVRKGD